MDTTAFQVAKGISQNLGQGYEKFQGEQNEKMDLSTMGQILKEATESDDPQAIDNAMSQMLSRVKGLENRKLGADILQKKVAGIQKAAKDQADADKKSNVGEEEFKKDRSKAISKYVNNSLEKADSAADMQFSIDTARKAISGDIEGPGHRAVIKKSPFGQLLLGLTPDEASLQAANKKLLEGTKGLFGPKPTEREIFLLLNEMLPSIGKSEEANLRGIDFIDDVNSMVLLKNDVINQITENGTKFVPDLEFQVQQQMKPHTEELRDKLRNAASADANSSEQNVRTKVQPGTPFDKSIGKKYLKLANGNLEQAQQMAREDGYEF
jgi:hypothetical protein